MTTHYFPWDDDDTAICGAQRPGSVHMTQPTCAECAALLETPATAFETTRHPVSFADDLFGFAVALTRIYAAQVRR